MLGFWFSILFLLQGYAETEVGNAPKYCQITTDPLVKYIEGEWIPYNEEPSSSRLEAATKSGEMFQCCDGQVAYDYSKVCSLPGVPHIEDHGCYCHAAYAREHSENNTVPYYPTIAKYDWKPHSCDLTRWNAKTFCEKLNNRKVLIIGDSTMAQTYGTLASMIFQSQEFPSSDERDKCLSLLTFQHSDFLMYQAEESRGLSLVTAIRSKRGFHDDMVIMSTGAHYDMLIERQNGVTINDEAYGNYFFPKLKDDLAVLNRVYTQEMKRNFTFIYKTENPGHPHCAHYTTPMKGNLNNKEEEKILLHSKFHWENSFVLDRKLIGMASELGVKVIQMNPLFLRPESHAGLSAGEDCLHYCTPGPLNLFSLLLFQALLNNEI
jgi:hypothetical protein